MKLISLNIVAFVVLCGCDMAAPEAAAPEAAAPEAAPPRLDTPAVAGHAAAEPAALAAPLPLLEPTPVDDIADLPGEYYRPFALPGQFSSLMLYPLEQGQGEYTLYRSCGVPVCVPETGTYDAVGVNPAVGFAFLQFRSEHGLVDTYLLDFFWRDASGEVVAVQMRRLLPGDLKGPSFVMWRYPEPDSEPIERTAEVPELEPTVYPAIASVTESPAPGLASVYVRPLPPPGEIAALTLGEPSWQDGVGTGGYQVARPYCLPWCFPEVGQYEIDLANPLTGSGWLTLRSASSSDAPVSYLVDGIWRNPVGDIVALQLQRVHAGGILGAPFFLYRQWWDAAGIDAASLPEPPPVPIAAAGAGDSALCVYYQNMETYYRTRALQCAYSACYPMSPYYGWWANYYRELAQDTCPEL